MQNKFDLDSLWAVISPGFRESGLVVAVDARLDQCRRASETCWSSQRPGLFPTRIHIHKHTRSLGGLGRDLSSLDRTGTWHGLLGRGFLRAGPRTGSQGPRAKGPRGLASANKCRSRDRRGEECGLEALCLWRLSGRRRASHPVSAIGLPRLSTSSRYSIERRTPSVMGVRDASVFSRISCPALVRPWTLKPQHLDGDRGHLADLVLSRRFHSPGDTFGG